MKLAFTLDYELFLGDRTGSVRKCLLEPLNLYIEQTERFGVRFTIFVDASYIYMLRKYSQTFPVLKDDYDLICSHLVRLHNEGHDIQLHIHPQWFFSEFDGERWHLDHSHYKITDVDEKSMSQLFLDSKNLLDEIVGKKTIAFRAGGFSAQPFSQLRGLFEDAGILIDSSVCPGAYYDSLYQKYDYRNAPSSPYLFESDICKPDENGSFLEIPLTMYNVSPLFHWKLVAVRLFSRMMRKSAHKCLGDGTSVSSSRQSVFERLFKRVFTMTTIDGYKIGFAKSSIKEQLTKNTECICLLGHPKLATPYSIAAISSVCQYAMENNIGFVTFSQLYNEKFEKKD